MQGIAILIIIFPNPDHKCKSKMVSNSQKERMRGFWPFYNEAEGERVLAVSDSFQGTMLTTML